MLQTCKIQISGQVQGVGFRPHVYKLAHEFNLKGSVSNNENGVVIVVSGLKETIQQFYETLIHFPPPVSNIIHHKIAAVQPQHFKNFTIIPSKKNGQVNLALTPDFAICDSCKKEIKTIKNKRYNYPFTTCVNCGPRYAVTNTFPFERAHTSLEDFEMCEDCKEEYLSPNNRRFHSQTNSCNTCGISYFLTNHKGEKLNIKTQDIFKNMAHFLSEGKIIAIKNTAGYLLCCNAENKEVVQQLRNKKNRPNKPFAVLYPSLKHLQQEAELNTSALKSLTSPKSPINIISLKNYRGKIALQQVAPSLNQLGVMLPTSGIIQLLANELNFPIVATSGNIHGSPIISDNKEALEKLLSIADYFFQHNLEILHPQDDSVVKFSTKFNREVMFRRARGFAPNYFNSPINTKNKILAMGAHLKSSIAFYPNQYLYISEYLGNLDNFDAYKRFTETTNSYLQLFEQKPTVVLADKHPAYQSTQYAQELARKYNTDYDEIQHHKAHFAAILGEHHLFSHKVLGVIFDGTGYGDDGNIWGGEFFNYEENKIKRIQHLEYYDWLLGNKMAKEPRLSLFSLASEEMTSLLTEKFSKSELKNYATLKKTNPLKTSSVGRLFDAVASLLNITDFNSYEGEAAMLLENKLGEYDLKSCNSYILNAENNFSAKEIIINIYNEIIAETPVNQIIANFLFTLANAVLKFAKINNYEKIAFSGGVFQNTVLVDMLVELAPVEIKLYFHKDLSPNDENISFGQLMYYLNITK